MKKILAISLLLCITIPIMGTYGWLTYEKHQTKKQVKQKLKSSIHKSQLVILKFTDAQAKTELEWEDDKEFEYKGEMYDVVTKETNGDTITYWCWWDHKETALNKHLAQLVSDALNNSPNRNKQQKQLLHFYTTLFYQPISNHLHHSTVSSLPVKQYIYCYIQYNDEQKSPPTPPPQLALYSA